jgi:hypothetical protein
MEGDSGEAPEETAIKCVVWALSARDNDYELLWRSEGWQSLAHRPVCGVPPRCGQGDRVSLGLRGSEQQIGQNEADQEGESESRQACRGRYVGVGTAVGGYKGEMKNSIRNGMP